MKDSARSVSNSLMKWKTCTCLESTLACLFFTKGQDDHTRLRDERVYHFIRDLQDQTHLLLNEAIRQWIPQTPYQHLNNSMLLVRMPMASTTLPPSHVLHDRDFDINHRAPHRFVDVLRRLHGAKCVNAGPLVTMVCNARLEMTGQHLGKNFRLGKAFHIAMSPQLQILEVC